MIFYRPYGDFFLAASNPGLTPGAIFFVPLRGLERRFATETS
jgi:hypothetical protein